MDPMYFKIHATTLEKMPGGQGQKQKYMFGHKTKIHGKAKGNIYGFTLVKTHLGQGREAMLFVTCPLL